MGGGNELWVKILESKYGTFLRSVESFLSRNLHASVWSEWWRVLVHKVGACNWFRENCNKNIGDGEDTCFWEEKWGPVE